MRCWWCGAQPGVTVIGMRLCGDVDEIVTWPASSDHRHATAPPTPLDLENAGRQALMRILAQVVPSEELLLPMEQVR